MCGEVWLCLSFIEALKMLLKRVFKDPVEELTFCVPVYSHHILGTGWERVV